MLNNMVFTERKSCIFYQSCTDGALRYFNPFMVKFSQRIKILVHLRHEVLSNYIFSESSRVAEQDGGTLVA